MNPVRLILRRLRSVLRKESLDAEMSDEIKHHLESQEKENLRRGMAPAEARYAAQRMFGGVEQVKERARDQRGWVGLEQLVQDLRFGGRQLGRAKGFTAAVVVTLGLGLGANTAIFSAVYSVLLRPLPYAAPEELFTLQVIVPERSGRFDSLPARIQDYLAWREAPAPFSAVAAVRPAAWVLAGTHEPERLGGARISPGFFSFLGVPLQLGREFTADEARVGNDAVVIISDGLWRRRFAADPGVIGRTIQLGTESHVVIGVTSPALLVPTGTLLHWFLEFAPRVEVWKPIAPTADELKGESWNYGLLLRMPGASSIESGRQQMQARLNESIRAQVPDYKGELQVRLVPLREIFSGRVRERLWLLFGASVLLLAIAVTNAAGLLLARVTSRAGEFATRLALGASRARVVRQTLTESLVLTGCGGVAGLALAWAGGAWLARHAPPEVGLLTQATAFVPMLLFAGLAVVATALACAVIPVWHLYHRDVAVAIQEGGRGALGGRGTGLARQCLVGFQIAMGTGLVLTAALLLQSFSNVMRADRGYAIERVLAADVTVSGARYNSREKQAGFFSALVERARSLPGVQAVGGVTGIPATAETTASQVVFRDDDTTVDSNLIRLRPIAGIRGVTPGYFAATETALRAGRLFREREETSVAVIGESLAQRLWPDEPRRNLIGRRLKQGDVKAPPTEVIGIVADVRAGEIERDLPPQLYRPHHQWSGSRMTLVLKTATEPGILAPAFKAELHQLDPALPLPTIRTMQDVVSAELTARRFQMELATFFAVIAFVLALVGAYGVVNYAVTCRTREIGVRMALGATRGAILRTMGTMGMKPVVAGLAAGLILALVSAYSLRAYLYGIAPTDPATFALTIGLLLTGSALACYLPARRAAGTDPVIALRSE